MKRLTKPVIMYPLLTLIIIMGITAFLGYNLKNLEINNDISMLVPDDHYSKLEQKETEKDFGKAEMVVVGLMADTIYTTDFLAKVKDFSAKLKNLKIESDPFVDPDTGKSTTKQKRCIDDVVSLSTIPYIEGDEYGMRVEKLLEDVPQTAEEMEALKKRVTSWDMYEGNIVSRDGKGTLIGITYKNGLSYAEIRRMVLTVRQTIQEMNFSKDVSVNIAGEPFVSAMIVERIFTDTGKMLPMVFAVVIIFLLISLRRVSSVVIIFVSIGISVVWCMGLMPLLGYKATLISSSIPVLLVAVGSAYSIHIINHYTEERVNGKTPVTAIENTMDTIGIAVFGAAATTVAGFLSFMTTSIIPIRDFGLLTAIGTAISFILSLTFVPAVLLVTDRFMKSAAHDKKAIRKAGVDFVPYIKPLADFLTRHKTPVFTVSIIVFAASLLLMFNIYSDMNPIKNFRADSEIRKAEDLLNNKFSGMTTLVVTIETNEKDFFKRPDPLKKLDEFTSYIRKEPNVGMVTSLALSIKRMNYAMNANDKEFDAIPDNPDQISQYLLLYGNPDDLEKMVTTDFRKVKILILLKDGSVKTLEKINTLSKEWLAGAFPGLKISMGGTAQIGLAANNLVVIGQIWNLVSSVAAVYVIAALIFRSFLGGLITIMPLSICIMLNFGILGLLGIPLDLGTALIASIGIGTGVDYSIHFLNGVRHGYALPGTLPTHTAIKITGNAIIFNAISVAFGFLVLAFSTFVPLIKLGVFVALTMITSSMVTLLLLPVIINVFQPKFLMKL